MATEKKKSKSWEPFLSYQLKNDSQDFELFILFQICRPISPTFFHTIDNS